MKQNKQKGYGFLWVLVLLPAALAVKVLAQLFPQGTEIVYSRHIYPLLSAVVSAVFGLFPFSVAEMLLVVLIVWALGTLLWGILRIFWKGPRTLLRAGLKIVAAACVGFFLFTVMWGLNYDRQPLAVTMKLKAGSPTKAELIAVTDEEITAVNGLCPQVMYNKQGQSIYPGGFKAVAAQVNAGYDWMEMPYKPQDRLIDRVQAKPKSVFPSNLMAYAGIEGIFIPFTYEPTVDAGYPEFILPFTASHETAHFKGFAREDEANFLAYLSCINNPDAYFHYSAHMNALLYLSGALYDTDPASFKREFSKLDKRAVRDVNAYNSYIDRYQSKFQKAAAQINDSYLKSQGQKGVVSYDDFVVLLCDRYRTDQKS